MHGLAQLLVGLALLAPPPLFEVAPRREPITFVLPLSEEQGGGEVKGSAGAVEYERENFAVLSGGVELHYQDVTVRAEVIEMDLVTRDLEARGNVILDQGPDRVTGGTATYNLRTKTGTVTDATASVGEGYYFSGETVSKVDDEVYTFEDGIFTSCEGEVPPWSFSVRSGEVELEDYAHLKGAGMRVKQVPVLYLPYVVWPTKTERSSGLLVPKLGYSNDRGGYLGLAYYQVLGRSWDTTVYTDLWEKEYWGGGAELRYHPTEGTQGLFQGYAIWDPLADDWRWKVDYEHETNDLPFGMRGVLRYEDYSDFDFFRDFERQINYKSRASVYSSGYVSGNWGNQSVNLLVDRRQTFTNSGNTIELSQLPELEYKIRPTSLFGLPVYLQLDSAAHYLSVDRSETYQGEYGRLELDPRVKIPLSNFTWLSASVTVGERLTWYGDSIATVGGDTSFTGESLTRLVPIANAEVIGPSFSRIFSLESGAKVKHIIEPRFDYSYQDEFDEQREVPVFDELDGLAGRNLGRAAIINRILAKPAEGAENADLGAREVFSLELGRRWTFESDGFLESGDGQQSSGGPLELILRSYPSERLGLRLDADYSLLFDELTSVRLSGNVGFGATSSVTFSWSPSYRATTGETLSNQATVGLVWSPLPGKLNLRSAISYDFERSLLRDQRHFLTFLGSCYTLKLEYHESQTSSQERRDFLFSVDLKNVGTFLDLTGGESEGF